jgi:hypothetical protein
MTPEEFDQQEHIAQILARDIWAQFLDAVEREQRRQESHERIERTVEKGERRWPHG